MPLLTGKPGLLQNKMVGLVALDQFGGFHPGRLAGGDKGDGELSI